MHFLLAVLLGFLAFSIRWIEATSFAEAAKEVAVQSQTLSGTYSFKNVKTGRCIVRCPLSSRVH